MAVAAVLPGVVLLGAGCAAKSAVRALPPAFTITARYTAKSLGLDHPAFLAIGPDNGDLYVTDLSQRVTVISRAGKVLRRWGGPGSRPGQFRFVASDPTVPTDVHASVAVSPRGDVYVSDGGNDRVQVFTADGRFIRQFGSFGTEKGEFIELWDLVVDRAGDVYVSDDSKGVLMKFSPAGKFVWQIGGGPLAATSVDAHSRLVVVSSGDHNRVLYVDPSGRTVDQFTPSAAGSPTKAECHATVDAAGDTYVAGCGTDTGPTAVYNPAHQLIARWPGRPYALFRPPVFGPHGEVFALATDGSILKLRVTLPGA
jgi:DNA-binding beta-propeller fold protein YncE